MENLSLFLHSHQGSCTSCTGDRKFVFLWLNILWHPEEQGSRYGHRKGRRQEMQELKAEQWPLFSFRATEEVARREQETEEWRISKLSLPNFSLDAANCWQDISQSWNISHVALGWCNWRMKMIKFTKHSPRKKIGEAELFKKNLSFKTRKFNVCLVFWRCKV